MKNGIIIPCYNEADRLQFDRFEQFINENSEAVLCFVNDGSKDSTLEQLQGFQAKHAKKVLVVNLEQNSGKAEAVRQGAQKLLSLNEINTIGYLDADLATGFDDYSRLVDVLRMSKKNMVFGSRKMQESEEIERSFLRKLASNIIGRLIHLIIGMSVKDTQCGAKVFTRSTASYLFSKSFMSRWLFDVELFIRMKSLFEDQTMSKMAEVPLMSWEEVDGSKITLKDSLKFPMQLLEIGYAYKVRPQLSQVVNTYSLGILNRAA